MGLQFEKFGEHITKMQKEIIIVKKKLPKETEFLDSFCLILVKKFKKIGTFKNKQSSVEQDSGANNMCSLGSLTPVTGQLSCCADTQAPPNGEAPRVGARAETPANSQHCINFPATEGRHLAGGSSSL